MAEEHLNTQPEDMPSNEFVKGFNHAYILAAHEPELFDQITPKENPANEYFDGFFAGKEEYQREQVEKDQLNELENIRGKSNDRSAELER